MHERRGHGAVQPHDHAVFELHLPSAQKQGPVELFPGAGGIALTVFCSAGFCGLHDHGGRAKGAKRGEVLKVESQLLVAQLPILFEQRSTASSGQALLSGRFDAAPDKGLAQPGQADRNVHLAIATSPSAHSRSHA